MKKKEYPKWLVYGLAIFCLLALWLYQNGDIGMSEQAMREENRDWVKDAYTVKTDIGDSMAVFFQYCEDKTECDVRIYVKRQKSFGIGWFFRYGGAISSVSGPCDFLNQMELEGNGEYALFGMNTTPVSRIEVIESEDSRRTIIPEEGKPFACVLKHEWLVTVYGADGEILQPVERNM